MKLEQPIGNIKVEYSLVPIFDKVPEPKTGLEFVRRSCGFIPPAPVIGMTNGEDIVFPPGRYDVTVQAVRFSLFDQMPTIESDHE